MTYGGNATLDFGTNAQTLAALGLDGVTGTITGTDGLTLNGARDLRVGGDWEGGAETLTMSGLATLAYNAPANAFSVGGQKSGVGGPWSSGTATFYEGVDPPSSGFPLKLDAWEILDEGIQRRIAAGFESKLILERGQDHVVQADRIDTAIATAALPDDVRAALLLCSAPHSIEEVAQFVTEQPDTTDPQRGYRVAALLLALGAVHWV